MARHIFIDNSNIYGGAQRAAEQLDPGIPWMAVRVYYRNLFQLLEHGGGVFTRVLAGSVPPGNEDLWDYARRAGYDLGLLRRVHDDDGRLVEQGVDELLHLKIANCLLDHRPPQILVIASGDGRVSDWNTGFPLQARRALDWGWDVEVWSWRDQLTREYERLGHEYPGRVHVQVLDSYYPAVTFVKEGHFVIRGVGVQLAGRVVSPLRIVSPSGAGSSATALLGSGSP